MDQPLIPSRQNRGSHSKQAPHSTFSTMLLLAAVAGLSVANVYCSQPLLDDIAKDLTIDRSTVGAVVSLTQVGYALGLILILPLGDLLDRRRLILTQLILSSFALVIVATASSAMALFGGMLSVGFLAVVVQVAVSFSASLTAPSERGKAIGLVTGGVVIGILSARLFAGIVSDLGGWRAVYLSSAALSVVVVALLFVFFPRECEQKTKESYFDLLRSTPLLFVNDVALLSRGLLALLIFASFSTFWTPLVLLLRSGSSPFSHTEIGLFGLAGIVGAFAAHGAGRRADMGLAQSTTGWALFILLISWAPIACLPVSITFSLVGVVLLDLGIQAVHVSNQSLLISRHPEAKSRLIGGYMVFYSVGSAIGAVSSTAMYAFGGWVSVCVLGAIFSLCGLGLWAASRHVD
jgi:predicted MFS family arabinose efflux permease